MRHARPDYQGRIVDVRGRIPDDEPVFLLRGQDQFAPEMVTAWAEANRRAGGDDRLIRAAYEQAQAMRDWQRRYGAKVPDLPPDLIETKSFAKPED